MLVWFVRFIKVETMLILLLVSSIEENQLWIGFKKIKDQSLQYP